MSRLTLDRETGWSLKNGICSNDGRGLEGKTLADIARVNLI